MADETPITELRAELRDPRPLSINVMYKRLKNGSVFLTKDGKHFKARLIEVVSQATMVHEFPWKHVIDAVYKQGGRVDLVIWLYVDDLLNNAWKVGGGTTGTGNPRSPYKSMDASNYIKLIEDAVKDATGIDDSCNLDVTIRKREDKKDPRVVIVYRVFE